MKKDNIFDKESEPIALLVSVLTPDKNEHENEVSLDELERLLETAGGKMLAKIVQSRPSPDIKSYVGAGKLEEIKEICENNGVTLVVCDDELSPSQIRNMEDAIGDVRVIDRSMLILDIFALHATSGEGKLQVELAQLRYTLPRLIGKGSELSRLGGGIGTRGPGESKLETDRRHIQRRIVALENEIREMENNRSIQRARREKSGIQKVAVVGYTNAGKSTLMNRLTGAGILAEDKLFATLDPTTRKYSLPSGREILLTDTVGFIRNLPHHLIRAFKSTLDEARYADALLIVIDASDPEAEAQLEVTEKLLYDLGASSKPTVCVFNKCDVSAGISNELMYRASMSRSVAVSALDGRGIDDLVAELERIALAGKSICLFKIPNSAGGDVAYLYRNATVENIEYEGDFALVLAVVDDSVKGKMQKYIVKTN
ncbi:MAG: GTPase HflX [Ruminococcaceae bacterium]|nr:GTPase HflX [Oscillospiraceae bacterium]